MYKQNQTNKITFEFEYKTFFINPPTFTWHFFQENCNGQKLSYTILSTWDEFDFFLSRFVLCWGDLLLNVTDLKHGGTIKQWQI